MKSLVIAFAICITSAVLCFLMLNAAGVNQDIAKVIATIVLGGFPKLRETIEKMLMDKGDSKDELRRYEEFNINPWLCLLYVTVIGFVAVEFTGGVAGMLLKLLGVPRSQFGTTMSLLIFLVAFPVLYISGRWIGRRCRNYPVLLALSCAPSIRLVTLVFDKVLVSGEIYDEMIGKVNIVEQLIFGALIIAIPLLIGVLIGRKQKLSSYFTYLLTKLSPESRLALLDLAFEDATQLKQKGITSTATP